MDTFLNFYICIFLQKVAQIKNVKIEKFFTRKYSISYNENVKNNNI